MKFYEDQQEIDNFQDNEIEKELELLNQELGSQEIEDLEEPIVPSMQNPYTQEKITGETLPDQPEIEPVSNSEYEEARDRSDKLNLYSNLLRSFQGVNQAVGQAVNPNFRSDMGVADNLAKQADQEMQEYYKKIDRLDIQNEEKLRDPNSEESKFAQEFVMKINSDLNPEAVKQQNAWNLYRQFPQMQQLLVNKMKADQAGQGGKKRYQFPVGMKDGVPTIFTGDTFTGELKASGVEKGYSPKIMKDEITGKYKAILPDGSVKQITDEKDLKETNEALSSYEKLQTNAPKIVDKFDKQVIDQYNKETKEDENLLYKFEEINNLIDQALKDPKSVQFGVLAGQVTRLIEKGMLTDKDLDRYVAAYDLSGKFKDTISKMIVGNPTPETLRRIKSTLDNLQKSRSVVLSKRALDSVKKFHNRHKARLNELGVEPKDLVPLIESESLTGKSTEIKRKTKDGRTAVFDENKNFLRYED